MGWSRLLTTPSRVRPGSERALQMQDPLKCPRGNRSEPREVSSNFNNHALPTAATTGGAGAPLSPRGGLLWPGGVCLGLAGYLCRRFSLF